MKQSIDESFLPFSEFITELADLEGKVGGVGQEEWISMEIETAELGLPFELSISVAENGEVSLGGVPPLYYLETSFTPVFHQLSLTLEPISSQGYDQESIMEP